MSRLQLLLPLLLWAVWMGHRAEPLVKPWMGVAIYLLALALLVLLTRRLAWRAMVASRHVASRATERFHQALFGMRLIILALHMVALFYLGWGHVVLRIFPWHEAFQSVPIIISMLPVLAAWVGLMWAQYPLDRSIREQNVVFALDAAEPVYPLPTFGQYLIGAIRLQILFMLVPVLAAIMLRDVMLLIAARFGGPGGMWELIGGILPVAIIFLIAPELLRRVLPTQRLPPSPLRDRLEEMCARLKLRYRDILIWHTHHALGNAAVMGLIPQVRYVMISDLLLATMNQRQIEAVFAHEAGHIVHRHMTWYVVFILVFVLWVSGLEWLAGQWLPRLHAPAWLPADLLIGIGGILAFFLIFGRLSRSFERQADLFAARSLTNADEEGPPDRAGVEIFSSALTTVARLNHMPVDGDPVTGRRGPMRIYARIAHHAANWLHGSIRSRVEYLHSLPANPARTIRFDRSMAAVRIVLLVTLCSTTAWVLTSMIWG